uniref:FHA domain-containing protein n=1 Tax=Globisporangium ultimum (strain ATCC 200006 / CBS 805.95 / DAOM BR144) TaxID=431595 RepID=K3WWU9_GLOUD
MSSRRSSSSSSSTSSSERSSSSSSYNSSGAANRTTPPSSKTGILLGASSRRPEPTVKWNWLHATACSSAIVASFAYMQTEASHYFAQNGGQRIVLSQASSAPMSSGGAKSGLSTTQYLRYVLVTAIMAAWFLGLIMSREYRLHFPVKRVGKRLVGFVEKIKAIHDRHQTRTKKRRQSHAHRRRHSWGYFGVDREIDELDLLVVTSLSPERNVLLPPAKARRSSSVQSNSSNPSMEQRRSGGKSIVLNPRNGARGGRHQSNQIVSDDPYVSRYHFQIQYDPMEKEYFLQDLGSTTGTFLFLKPNVPKRLRIHDRVKLGDTEFEVVAIDENPATKTPFLRICFTEGPLTGIGQTLGRTAVTLGRRSSNALCITDDGSISGRHSVISYLGDGFYITDLDSTNGTAVRLSASGEKSRRRYLLHGDVFGVGSNRFLVEYSHQLEAQRQPRRDDEQQLHQE